MKRIASMRKESFGTMEWTVMTVKSKKDDSTLLIGICLDAYCQLTLEASLEISWHFS